MKTKTIGSTTYMVVKYFTNNQGELDVAISRWSKKGYAFRDRNNHREQHGKDSAHVFKAKQCIEVE